MEGSRHRGNRRSYASNSFALAAVTQALQGGSENAGSQVHCVITACQLSVRLCWSVSQPVSLSVSQSVAESHTCTALPPPASCPCVCQCLCSSVSQSVSQAYSRSVGSLVAQSHMCPDVHLRPAGIPGSARFCQSVSSDIPMAREHCRFLEHRPSHVTLSSCD